VFVLDSSVVLPACAATDGFEPFGPELVAPPLLASEVLSALHAAVWRGDVAVEQAEIALARFEAGPVRIRSHARLARTAWAMADALGWAKTYDAEFLALAQLLGCRLVTSDQRLRRAAAHLGFVMLPSEVTGS